MISLSIRRHPHKGGSMILQIIRWGWGIAVLCVMMGVVPSAYALNGIRVIASGSIHRSLGGAGVAKPLDATAIVLNPAGMNAVGHRFDADITVGFPQVSMDTTAAAGNATSSQDEGAILPSTGVVFPFWNNKMAFGLGAFVTSGFGVDYPASRLPTAATANAYDTTTRYGLMKFIPALSYKIRDDLTVGAALHFDYAFFHTDSATATGAQTAGRGRFDPAVGAGGSLGVIYEPYDWLSAGVTYTTRQYFEKFDRYGDLLLGSFDMPQEVTAGVAVSPFDSLWVMGDFRWINWSGVGTLGNTPAAGGFGWRDQYVFMLGTQYNFKDRFNLPVTLRLGYNYARSLIPASAAYSNMLVPGILEHHVTMGLGYEVSKKTSVNVSYTHDFEKTVTATGTGAGSTLKVKADLASLQLGVAF